MLSGEGTRLRAQGNHSSNALTSKMKNEIAELHELVAQIEKLLAAVKERLDQLAPAS